MPKLTAEAVKRYVKTGGVRCPYCNSMTVETRGSMDIQASFAFQSVACGTCHAEWTDEYTLTGITELPDGVA